MDPIKSKEKEEMWVTRLDDKAQGFIESTNWLSDNYYYQW